MTHSSRSGFPHQRLDAWHIALDLAEGASRVSAADKRSRFIVARGECAECDATLETAARLGLFPADEIRQVRRLADRVSAMLTGLVKRAERRLPANRRLTEPEP